MYISPLGKTATAINTADIIINEFEYFSYTDKFKYDIDIQRQITQACGAFATMKHVLCNEVIPVKLRV